MIKKVIFIFIGILSSLLGILGIFLPILPTTPFLLLSSFLFLRSSSKLYNLLMNSNVFGIHLRGYIEYRTIKLQTKISSIAILWIGILTTVIFFTSLLWLRILLLVIAVSVSIHLISLKSMTNIVEDKIKEDIEKKIV